jgi:hypothetical protein
MDQIACGRRKRAPRRREKHAAFRRGVARATENLGAILGPYPRDVALERESSLASQAEGRGFETRRPLPRRVALRRRLASWRHVCVRRLGGGGARRRGCRALPGACRCVDRVARWRLRRSGGRARGPRGGVARFAAARHRRVSERRGRASVVLVARVRRGARYPAGRARAAAAACRWHSARVDGARAARALPSRHARFLLGRSGRPPRPRRRVRVPASLAGATGSLRGPRGDPPGLPRGLGVGAG